MTRGQRLALRAWHALPAAMRGTLLDRAPRPVRAAIASFAATRLSDVAVVSFPKCGRTWLRALLGVALHDHFELSGEYELTDIHRLADRDPRVPRVHFLHDDDPHLKAPGELRSPRDAFRDKAVVFLVRDPRDVLVSLYHHKRFRSRSFRGALEDYLRQPVGSIDTLIAYYDMWLANRDATRSFLLLRYEDLHAHPREELARVMRFLGVPSPSPAALDAAVRFASFSNMRAMEESGRAGSDRLRATERGEGRSFKTREGRVGGFLDHLGPAEVAYLDERIARRVDPALGYGSLRR